MSCLDQVTKVELGPLVGQPPKTRPFSTAQERIQYWNRIPVFGSGFSKLAL